MPYIVEVYSPSFNWMTDMSEWCFVNRNTRNRGPNVSTVSSALVNLKECVHDCSQEFSPLWNTPWPRLHAALNNRCKQKRRMRGEYILTNQLLWMSLTAVQHIVYLRYSGGGWHWASHLLKTEIKMPVVLRAKCIVVGESWCVSMVLKQRSIAAFCTGFCTGVIKSSFFQHYSV